MVATSARICGDHLGHGLHPGDTGLEGVDPGGRSTVSSGIEALLRYPGGRPRRSVRPPPMCVPAMRTPGVIGCQHGEYSDPTWNPSGPSRSPNASASRGTPSTNGAAAESGSPSRDGTLAAGRRGNGKTSRRGRERPAGCRSALVARQVRPAVIQCDQVRRKSAGQAWSGSVTSGPHRIRLTGWLTVTNRPDKGRSCLCVVSEHARGVHVRPNAAESLTGSPA
jgi:hypothetical protein